MRYGLFFFWIITMKMLERKHQFTGKELFLLLFPLMVDSLLSVMIGMADTIMVATNGEAAISGVALVDSISYLLINLFSAFATGGAVVVSQYIGKGDGEKAKDSAKNLVYIALGISLLIVLLVMPFRGSLIDLVFGQIAPDVKRYTDDYFVPLLLSYPFLAVYTALTALSRSESRSVRTMVVSASMNAVNIIGNAVLIFIFRLGPMGAGIASLLSRVFGSAVMLALMLRPADSLSLSGIAKGPVSPALMKKIASIAIPAGLESSVFQLGKIAVQSLVASLGTSAIAINALVSNVNVYSNIPGFGINLGAITIIGQCRGRDNFADIKHYSRLLLAIFFICTFVVILPFLLLSPQIVSLYSLEPASAARAVPMTRLCLIMCWLIWPFGFVLPNILKACGDVRYSLFASLASMWLFRVGSAYIQVKVFGMGIEAIWYAMYLDWLSRGVLYASRLLSGKWKSIKVI